MLAAVNFDAKFTYVLAAGKAQLTKPLSTVPCDALSDLAVYESQKLAY